MRKKIPSLISGSALCKKCKTTTIKAETTIQSPGRQTKLNRLATVPYSLGERLVQEFESLHM